MTTTRSHDLADALRALLQGKPGARAHAERELAAYDDARKSVAASRERHRVETMPVVISGRRFPSRGSAMHSAMKAGFNASPAVFYARVAKGLSWEECIKPADPARAQRMRDSHIRKRKEMQDVLDTMEPRK